jgi:drug/metabolite transporter (DMT)-like permease
MIYLILSIISSVMIAVVIRINEGKNLDRFAVMLFNYFAATAFALIAVNRRELISNAENLSPYAFFSAFCFVTAFVVYMLGVRRLGLAVSVTVTRLSVVIPVLGSVLVYSEALNPQQTGGFLLALIAITLFSGARSEGVSGTRGPGLLLAPLLFFLMGSGDFSLKIFHENFDPELTMSFILMVFGISSLYTFILVVARRTAIDRKTIVAGIVLGIPNFLAAYFILKVLQVYPGAIAFPLNNVGIIVLSTLTGYFVWKERFKRRTAIAMLISIAAVVLLNMGG